MVVLKSDTYGSAGTDIFATYEELVYAKKERMEIYVVGMAPRVKEPGVQAMLNTIQGSSCTEKDGGGALMIPGRAITDIQAILAKVAAEDE